MAATPRESGLGRATGGTHGSMLSRDGLIALNETLGRLALATAQRSGPNSLLLPEPGLLLTPSRSADRESSKSGSRGG